MSFIAIALISKEAASVGTHATCVTNHESIEYSPEIAACATPVYNVPPIIEESKASLDPVTNRQESDVSLHSFNLEIEAPPAKSKKSRHNRTATNELLMDYLQGDGASENRAMVRIESSGVAIEDVYYGVHDGDILGVGVTGNVRLITRKDTGTQKALKRLDLSNLRNKDELNRLLDEIKIMW